MLAHPNLMRSIRILCVVILHARVSERPVGDSRSLRNVGTCIPNRRRYIPEDLVLTEKYHFLGYDAV
jgi:hypothetical protein